MVHRCRHIYVINEDGSGLTLLGDSTAIEETPSWSPDGRKVAFTSNRKTGAFQIWVTNADGSSPVRLSSCPGGDSSGIYVTNADGSGQTRLTSAPPNVYENFPHWRP